MKRVALLLLCAAANAIAQPVPKKSGFEFMSPQTQAIQKDDAQNPGMLWVQEGAALWSASARGEKSCASCHDAAEQSMRGVAARYPAFDTVSKMPVNLAQRINLCRTRHQAAPPLAFESRELLALESFVALQSRGMPLAPPQDQALAPHRARGQQLYTTRIGQLDLSCAQCHDARPGLRLAGSTIPQGQVGNYPSYRLEWQTVGSLQRRLRNCMTGVRAEPYALGAPELVELELYLAQRSAGLLMEAPSVRP
ncbi:MAG: sulfur oxidation c-type cytochrome SoxA [Burkholderiaceae bacterium]